MTVSDDNDAAGGGVSLRRTVPVAVLVGAAGAAVALAFVALVAAGQSVLWPDPLDPSAFSGSIRIPIVLTAGGLIVGVIHTLSPSAQEENVFVALATGRIDATAVPGGVAIAAVTLIAGFSLGPEVPTGMAAAGVAAFAVSRRLVRQRDADVAMSAAISGAWGGLFTAPFTALLLNIELTVGRRVLRWTRLAADASAAIVGFTIFFIVDAGWSDVLRLLDLPAFELRIVDLAVAAGLGVAGAVVGTAFKLSMLGTRRLSGSVGGHPIVRCTIVGLVLGLVGMALPLTLFLGTEGLEQVTAEPATLGAGLIVASALVKVVATTGALSFGFVGGPIFPLLFIGGSLGSVVHLAIEDVPLALAVTASMAAVPSAVIPVPLSIATLTVLIAGLPPTESSTVFVAAVVALLASQAIETALPGPAPTAKG
ncbi:MAG: chloride channel protein [Acidimicrobiia bacterium]|nr:chloride channel protein [Acidimicrobiia bacterium]